MSFVEGFAVGLKNAFGFGSFGDVLGDKRSQLENITSTTQDLVNNLNVTALTGVQKEFEGLHDLINAQSAHLKEFADYSNKILSEKVGTNSLFIIITFVLVIIIIFYLVL